MSTLTPAAAPAPAPRQPLSLTRLSDELLARQAARGSDRAFTVLYERYHQPLYRYCRSIVRHDSDAQDVLQSTFTSALSAMRAQRRSAPLRPWLYRIAHNEAISLLRRRSRETDQEVTEATAPVVASAEDEAAGRARWEMLVEDLAGLPERQRNALLLRELSGLSHEEIAIALETNVGGAKQAIFEARQGLMELAEGRTMSCEEVRRRLSAGDRRVMRARRVRAHLRDCAGCAMFAAAIPERRAELRALAPALPSAAAAAVLSRTLRAASAHGASGAAAGSTAATAGGVVKAAGTALTWKALTGVALVATAAAGVTGIEHALLHQHARARAVGVHRGAAVKETRATSSGSVVQITVPGHRRGVAARAASTVGKRASSAQGVLTPTGTAGHGGAAAALGHAGAVPPGQVRAGAQAPGHAPVNRGGGSGAGRGQPGVHRAGGSSRSGVSARGDSGSAPGHTGSTTLATARPPARRRSTLTVTTPIASLPLQGG